MSYWPYLQARHFDQGKPLFDSLWNLIPVHRKFASDFYHVPGIVVPGVMALDGKPLGGWPQYSLSPTDGAWLAYQFYLHWRYTMDREFLAQQAYPSLPTHL